jgi:hypothetical protein
LDFTEFNESSSILFFGVVLLKVAHNLVITLEILAITNLKGLASVSCGFFGSFFIRFGFADFFSAFFVSGLATFVEALVSTSPAAFFGL